MATAIVVALAWPLLLVPSLALARGEPEPEPAFPDMAWLYSESQQMHIVTESISEESGLETLEEFVDFQGGKDTLIVTGKDGRNVLFVDANTDISYYYQPYSCQVNRRGSHTPFNYKGMWESAVWSRNHELTVHLYGVAALWMNAQRRAKTYSRSAGIYSLSKDTYRSAHRWTVQEAGSDPKHSYNYHFHFLEPDDKPASTVADGGGGAPMTLEMIQIESALTNRVVRTLNVISYDFVITDDAYDSLLNVPAGYGCVDANVSEMARIPLPSIQATDDGLFLSVSHRIELEVTATSYHLGESSRSDSMNVVLARTIVDTGPRGKNSADLQLVRLQDSKKDIKTVLNYHYNIQYKIDLVRGQCEMSNIGGSGTDKPDESERAALEFGNGLKLNIDVKMMKEVLTEHEGFHFVKRSRSGSKELDYKYYEKTSTSLFKDRMSRIVRVYSVGKWTENGRLAGATIWVLDKELKRVEEAYQLNVIGGQALDKGVDGFKLFDVSEECYLNNEQARAGRDYAWFQLAYPADSFQLEFAATHQKLIKSRVRKQLLDNHVDSFRVARIEVPLEDTRFLVRVLLLDVPSLLLLYDLKPNLTLSVDKAAGDIQELTVGAEHCADLCRLNDCKTMSICPQYHLCSLSVFRPTTDGGRRSLVPDPHCRTYVRPGKDSAAENDSFERQYMSLQRVLSLFRHQDYGAIPIPSTSARLTYPISETGLDPIELLKMKAEHIASVDKVINLQRHKYPFLVYFLLDYKNKLLALLPNEFELEQDPLEEFEAHDESFTSAAQQQQDTAASAGGQTFRMGLNLHRFKIHNVLMDDQAAAAGKKFRLFSGLEYDQCALACQDAGSCSSFSYCGQRQECIISDIYEIGSYVSSSTELDADCFIAQRDFLGKFNKFADVHRPPLAAYQQSVEVFNPSECAHSCMAESQFNCLAFDYCEPAIAAGNNDASPATQLGACFLLAERQLYTGIDGDVTRSSAPAASSSDGKQLETTISTSHCDHYSRSYLADFVRIEYRRLVVKELAKLKSSLIEGRTVDRCAEICVNELGDCSAFQFCLDLAAEGAKQRCIMIESKPEGADASDYLVKQDGNITTTGGGRKVFRTGKSFVYDEKCHVFALRRDSSESHQRELALDVDESAQPEPDVKSAHSRGGVSLGGALVLYVCLTLSFASIGCGLAFARYHNDRVRKWFERLHLLLGR